MKNDIARMLKETGRDLKESYSRVLSLFLPLSVSLPLLQSFVYPVYVFRSLTLSVPLSDRAAPQADPLSGFRETPQHLF